MDKIIIKEIKDNNILVAKNILVVSNRFAIEIEKINKKSIQAKLCEIIQKICQKEIHVLPVMEDEYIQAVTKFKSGERPPLKEPQIDFGEENKKTGSTEFLDNLLG